MTKKAETYIQEAIQRFVQSRGGFCFKTNPTNGLSLPDLIGGHKGIPFAVEVKTDNGEPTAGQLIVLGNFALQGYRTGVVRSVEEFQAMFTEELV